MQEFLFIAKYFFIAFFVVSLEKVVIQILSNQLLSHNFKALFIQFSNQEIDNSLIS
jgi:hypothetical protein